MAAARTPTQFGNVIGGDFSKDTLTIEMQPRFIVAAGPVAVVPQPVYGMVVDALTRIAEMQDSDGNLIEMHRDELRGIARTALDSLSAA